MGQGRGRLLRRRSARRSAGLARLVPAALAALALALTSCVTTTPFEEGDSELAFRVRELAAFGLKLPAHYGKYESLRRKHAANGVLMIEYEFNPPAADPASVYSIAARGPWVDGCKGFETGAQVSDMALRWSGYDPEVRYAGFHYGKMSRFVVLKEDGVPVGNVFFMCGARTAYLVSFTGVHVDDPTGWRKVIEPRLQALARLDERFVRYARHR